MTFLATAGILLLLTLVGASLVAVLAPKPEQAELPDDDPIEADDPTLPYGGGWGA
jgi:hypothetical protein